MPARRSVYMSVTPARDVSRCLTGSTTYSPATRQAAVWPRAAGEVSDRPSVHPSRYRALSPLTSTAPPLPPAGAAAPARRQVARASSWVSDDRPRLHRRSALITIAVVDSRISCRSHADGPARPARHLHYLTICRGSVWRTCLTADSQQVAYDKSNAYTTNPRRRKAGPTDTNRSATSPQQIRVMQFETHS